MNVQAAGPQIATFSQNRPRAEAAYPISRSDSLAVPPLGGDFENLARPTQQQTRASRRSEMDSRDPPQCRIAFMTALGNPHRHHTHRLDLDDPTIREWDATVLLADADQGIVLDRSAFYPGGGGQPPDHGVLLWGNVRTRIVGTRKGDDLYLLPAEGDPLPPAGRASTVASTTNAVPALCALIPAYMCSAQSCCGTSAPQ